MKITTRGYIEVYREGAFISRHRVETEAIESAYNTGPGEYTLRFPDKTVLITAKVDIYPPPAPALPTATVLSAESIRVDWAAVSDPNGIAVYKLERSISGGEWAEIYDGPALTFTDSGLVPATSYRYRVRAVDGDGYIGAYSSIVTAVTSSVFGWTIPEATYALGTVTAGATVDLSQFASTGSGSPAYTLVSGPSGMTVGQSTGILDTAGVAVGSYTVSVDLSNLIVQVTGLSVTNVYFSTVTLSWSAVPFANSYHVEQSVDGTTWTQIANSSATTYVVEGLSPSTAYQLRVRGTNGVHSGAYSATVLVTTTAEPATGEFEPAITGESQEEPYQTWDGGLAGATLKSGPTGRGWNESLGIRWTNADTGDYIGHDGTLPTIGADVQQSGSPFAVGTISAGAGNKTFNVTACVQRIMATGQNRGWYLRLTNTSHSVFFAGRTSANPPSLSVTTTNGTVVCPPTATAHWLRFISSENPQDGRTQFGVAQYRWSIIRFDLSAVTGTVTSATLTMYANTVTGTNPTLQFFEPNILRTIVGAGTETPRADGLASQYPADAFGSHPDVLLAGHFGGATVQAEPQTVSTKSTTSPSMPGATISYQVGGPVADTDAPGTSYWRGEVRNVVSGSVGRDPLIVYRRVMYPDLADASFPVDADTLLEEAYFRLYVMMEDDWVDTSEGCKFAITWDLRLGMWDTVAGWWNPQGGNSNHQSDGKRHLGLCHSPALNPEWTWTNSTTVGLGGSDYYSHPNFAVNCYKGHMQRQEPGFAIPAGRPYADHFCLKGYNYNNNLFDPETPNAYDSFSGSGGAFFNTGNILKPLLKKGRWYCIEQRLKMNTIDLSSPDALGNGVANFDGELETWVNGVRVDLLNNMAWRHHPDMGIGRAGTVWYIGGNGVTNWPTPWHFRTSHFAFAKSYIGPRVRA